MNQKKDFLKQIVCLRTVAQDSKADPTDYARVAAEQQSECVFVAYANARNEKFIRRLVNRLSVGIIAILQRSSLRRSDCGR